jgi:hypothetical protein
MSSDLVRYLATGGGTITLCGCIARVISLMMRLKFNRYVVDCAVEQGQPIDPVEIINAATSKTPAKPSSEKPKAAASPALPPRLSRPPGLGSRR